MDPIANLIAGAVGSDLCEAVRIDFAMQKVLA